MDLSHLRSFHAVARCQNFSKAADLLFTSQPALSRQVAALEKEVGLDLFTRHAKGVVLTEAGRRLFEYTEQIFDLLSQARKGLAEFKNLEAGALIAGASTTIGNYLLPLALTDYRKKYPGVEIDLKIGNSREVEELVLNRQADIGLLAGPAFNTGLYVEPILRDELVAVVANSHPLALEREVPLAALSEETLILREPGSDTRRATEEHLASRGVAPGKVFVLDNTEAIKKAASSGMGVAFLSRHTVELEVKHGALKPLEGEGWRVERQFHIAYPKDARLSPPALAFLALIKKVGLGNKF